MTSFYLPAEIELQPTVVRRVLSDADPVVGALADSLSTANIGEIVMTGCGDSLFAAMAASFAFLRYSKQFVHAAHAFEYSRAFYQSSGAQTLLCALSYSGETRRTLEAAIAGKSQGARILSLSVDSRGPISRLADDFVPNVSTGEQSNCRVGSFQAAFLTLVLLAAHTAHRSGHLDDLGLQELRSALTRLADVMEGFMGPARTAGERLAKQLSNVGQVYYVGAGIGHSIALYGSAKLYETSSVPAVPQETEQFAHCEIFSLETNSVAFVVALRGPFYDRAVEVATAIRTIGARVIGLSDNPGFGSCCDDLVEIPAFEPAHLSTSLACIPLQWTAFYDAVGRGANPDLVRHKEVNSPLIRGCPIWATADYQAAPR